MEYCELGDPVGLAWARSPPGRSARCAGGGPAHLREVVLSRIHSFHHLIIYSADSAMASALEDNYQYRRPEEAY